MSATPRMKEESPWQPYMLSLNGQMKQLGSTQIFYSEQIDSKDLHVILVTQLTPSVV